MSGEQLDHLDYPQAQAILITAAAIGYLLTDDQAAVIVANQALALDLVLGNETIEAEIDRVLTGPPVRWRALSMDRRWAGLYGAMALASELGAAHLEDLLAPLSPAQRADWIRAISPRMVQS